MNDSRRRFRELVMPVALTSALIVIIGTPFGCASSNGTNRGMETMQPEAPGMVPSRGSLLFVGAGDELGVHQLGTETTTTDRVPIVGPEPHARQLVTSMIERLTERDRPIVVSLSSLRNYSRSTGNEFASFVQRFADVLNQSAATDTVTFTPDVDSPAQFNLQGACYLTVSDGFEVWEMYLSLSPTKRSITIWRQPGTVRILRHARPNQPQVLPINFPAK